MASCFPFGTDAAKHSGLAPMGGVAHHPQPVESGHVPAFVTT